MRERNGLRRDTSGIITSRETLLSWFLGRVGRVGSKCSPKVTSLVCGQNSVKVVQELELAVRYNREVESTDANIARVIKDRRMEAEMEEQLD